MNSSLRGKMIASIALALLISCALGLFAALQMQHLVKTWDRTRALRERLMAVSDTLSLIKDCETGQRGYLITGEADYLAPYENAVVHLNSQMEILRRVTPPRQAADMAALEQAKTEKINELDLTVELRGTRGYEAARRVVLTDQGKRAMDAIRAAADRMLADDRQEIAGLMRARQTGIQRTSAAIALLILSQLFLLTWAYRLMRRGFAERFQTEAALEQQNGELEAQQASLQMLTLELTVSNERLIFASRRFEELFQGLPLACFCYDRNGHVFEWNRAFEDAYGLTAVQLFDRPLWSIPGFDEAEERAVIDQIFAGRTVEGRDFTHVDSGGRVRHLLATAFPLRGADEAIIGGVTAHIDITERKAAEIELAAARERERLLIDHAVDMICSIGPDGRFVQVSPASQAILGFAPEDLLGVPYISRVAPEDVEKTNEMAARIMSGQPLSDFWNRYLHRDGHVIDLMWSAFWSDEQQLMFCVARDITKMKQVEAALAEDAAHRLKVIAAQTEIAEADLGLDDLLTLIVEKSQELSHASGAALEMLDGAEMVYRAVSGAVSRHLGLRLSAHGSLSGLCARTGQSQRCDDTERDERVDRAACRKVGVGSMLIVPLRHDGRSIGALKVMSPDKHAFQDRDLATLQMMSGLMSAALARAAAADALQRSHDELEQRIAERTSDLTVLNGYLQMEVAERVQAETSLRESEARKAAILDSALDCVITIDADERVIDWNPAAERTFGYRREEAVGQKMSGLIIPPSLREAHRRGMAHYMATGVGPVLNRRLEITAMRRGGEDFPVELAVTAIPGGESPLFTAYIRDISDRKQAELALREGEERLRMMADAMPQIVWTSSPTDGTTFLNRRWVEYTGMGLEAARRDGVGSVFAPGEYDYCQAAWAAAAAAQQPFEGKYRFRRAEDGAYRWHLVRAVPRLDANGEILEWIGTSTDIDDEQRTQEALRESEGRIRFLANSMPQIVWTAQPDGTLDYFNQRGLDYTGFAHERMLREWTSVIHPEDREIALARWRQSVATGGDYQVEYRIRGASGEYRWHLGRAHALRNETGEITLWAGTCTDIEDYKQAQDNLQRAYQEVEARVEERTLELASMNLMLAGEVRERRDAETALRSAHQKLSSHMENSPLAVLEWDRDLTILHWSRGAEAIFGWSADEVVGKRVGADFEFIRPEDASEAAAALAPLLDGRAQSVVFEFRYLTKDGRTVDCQWHSSALVDPEGRFIAGFSLGMDMTEKNQAALALEAQAAELERSNAELQQFAFVASHDLQEPLRKIQTFGDRLAAKHGEALGDGGRDYLTRMQSAASRMQTLIQDLLALSRVTTQAKPAEDLDLAALMTEVLSDLEGRIEQTGGRVEVGPLPTLTGDPLQMRQVLQNLVGNALKYHRPEVPPVVRISARKAGADRWEIRVEDNGIGFDSQYAERVFQPFQRLVSRAEFEGTGMGLAIVKKVAERHGGSVRAEGFPGEGAAFTLTLPERRQDAPASRLRERKAA